MSFNIRYGTANDGENHWTNRRDMLFALLRTQNPDLLGLQEALRFQIDEILAAVPGYAVVGVGRDDGKAAGEMAAILFRTTGSSRGERHVLVLGHAGDPGSKTWGNRITRIASWARSSTATAAPSPTTTCTSITSRSRPASRARRCCCSASRRGPSPPSRSSSPATSTSASRTPPCTCSWDRQARRRCPPRVRLSTVHRYLPRGASRRKGSRHVHQFRLRANVGREDRLRAGAAGHDRPRGIDRAHRGRPALPVGSLPGHRPDRRAASTGGR